MGASDRYIPPELSLAWAWDQYLLALVFSYPRIFSFEYLCILVPCDAYVSRGASERYIPPELSLAWAWAWDQYLLAEVFLHLRVFVSSCLRIVESRFLGI